jgi:L-iditol 2-dehydrogenase
MQAVYLTEPGRFRVQSLLEPKLVEPDDVLLEMQGVGVCGSDMHYFKSGRIGTQVIEYPFILGHECAALVRAVGPEVQGIQVGDRVAVDPLVNCGVCDQCLAGRLNTCRAQRFLGCPGQLAGCMAERVVMPARCCFPVPQTLSLGAAVLVEPFAIALHAARLADDLRGLDVGVLGAGPIGLCVLAAARSAGAGSVVCTDRLDYRLRVAERLGAAWSANIEHTNVVGEVGLSKPSGLDVVFECSGEPEALDQAVELLKPGGTLLIAGIPESRRVSFDISHLRRKELTIKNVRRQNECTQAAIDALASGAIDLDLLVTHHFGFAESQRAFELVGGYGDGVLKALVHFD